MNSILDYRFRALPQEDTSRAPNVDFLFLALTVDDRNFSGAVSDLRGGSNSSPTVLSAGVGGLRSFDLNSIVKLR